MTYRSPHSIIEDFIKRCQTRGWARTYATFTYEIGGTGESWAQIYISDPDGKQHTTIYVSAGTISESGFEQWLADRLPLTVAEQTTKDFLELCSKLQEKAEDIGLKPDFINPIVALADQLRSNAIAHKPEEN